MIGWVVWNGLFLAFAIRNAVVCAQFVADRNASDIRATRNAAHVLLFLIVVAYTLQSFIWSAMTGSTVGDENILSAAYRLLIGSGLPWSVVAAMIPFQIAVIAERKMVSATGQVLSDHPKWFWLILLSPAPFIALAVVSGRI